MAYSSLFLLWLSILVLFESSYSKAPIVESSKRQAVPNIEFYPKEVKSVIENEYREVSFGITWENVSEIATFPKNSNPEFMVIIKSENPSILEVVNSSYPPCIKPDTDFRNFTFTVKGVFLGYTNVEVKLLLIPDGCNSYPDAETSIEEKKFELSVSVIRPPSILVDAVTGIMAALVAFNYVNMGVQLDMRAIEKVLKRPIGPTIGFVCQFLFMPVAAYGISWLLLDDVSLRLGLFTLGCSPGGSMSNFWTLLFRGDVNLSITMTFISTVAALAMMPLWIFTLGSSLFRDRAATIPYINLAGSLIILTIPIGFGLLIKQYSPRLSKLSEKIIKPVTLLCVVLGISVGLYANSFVFQLFTWQVAVAGLGIAWGGYSFGALVAWVFRLDRSQIIAVSIETAFQNPAVAFVMLLMSLPQPEADLTAVPVIVQIMLTGMPMWLLLIITRIYKKCKKDGESHDSDDMPKVELNKEYLPVAIDAPATIQNSGPLMPEDDNLFPKVKIVRQKVKNKTRLSHEDAPNFYGQNVVTCKTNCGEFEL